MSMLSIIAASRRRVFNPLSLAPAFWLDASDSSRLFDATTGGSLPANGVGVARWEDKSGNGRHVTQATSGFRPLRRVAIQNGLDVVRFDSSDDLLDSAAFTVAQPFTVFAVFQAAAATGVKQVVTRVDPLNLSVPVVHRAAASNTSGTNMGTGFFPLTVDTGWQIFQTATNGANTQIRRNGGAAATGNAGTTSILQVRIGNTTGGADGLNGDIGEILIIPGILDDTTRIRCEQYFSTKWNIPLV
jgi:hypothetical protein